MFVMTRSASSQTLSINGIYKMPPPGPLPPPGVPGPLPNIAIFGQAQTLFEKMTIVGLPACVMPGKIPMSSGDEASAGGPGGGGGVISGKFKGASQVVRGSTKLFLGGKPAVRMCDASMHDNNNAMGNTLMPSQTKFTVAS